jgi:hypothetical protein
MVTLLTSLWKAGKTTLLSMLLRQRKHGGVLAGLAVKPGKTLVVSEEPLPLLAQRARACGFDDQVRFLSRPFDHVPQPEEWQALLDHILALRAQHDLDLAVFDPLAPFLRSENQARTMLDALLPLNDLTSRGMAVTLLHHPAKGDRPAGQAARGSGALLGQVDISMEMRHASTDPKTRRRRFLALSRHAETPRHLLLEANAELTDYLPVAETPADDGLCWQAFRMVLQDATQKLTRAEILAQWPEDFARPAPSTLADWLNHAVEANLIAREGSGRKADPFRYWLPEREAVWKQSPLYALQEQCREMAKLRARVLREGKFPSPAPDA